MNAKTIRAIASALDLSVIAAAIVVYAIVVVVAAAAASVIGLFIRVLILAAGLGG